MMTEEMLKLLAQLREGRTMQLKHEIMRGLVHANHLTLQVMNNASAPEDRELLFKSAQMIFDTICAITEGLIRIEYSENPGNDPELRE